MEFIADLMLIAGALGAAFYCYILSRRLSSLNSAEGGIGEAISTLSEQVERLGQTLDGSREHAEAVEQRLRETVEQAEKAENALATALSAMPTPRTAAKPQTQRTDVQPASFRRRLFSDGVAETKS